MPVGGWVDWAVGEGTVRGGGTPSGGVRMRRTKEVRQSVVWAKGGEGGESCGSASRRSMDAGGQVGGRSLQKLVDGQHRPALPALPGRAIIVLFHHPLCCNHIPPTTHSHTPFSTAGANVILTTKGIDDTALKYFVEAGAIACRRVPKDDLR